MRPSSLLLLVTVTGVCAAYAAVGCGSNSSAPLPYGQPTPIPPGEIDGGPSEEFPSPPPGPPPDLGATTSQDKAPPPISGGTLIVLADAKTAVASDPDRDRVYIVDTGATTPAPKEIVLQEGDEPGRLIEDGHGKVHVALRRAGMIATIDVATGNVDGRREVCAAPRGIAYDKTADSLYVACAGGELVTMPATGGAATRTLKLEHDLRDVMIRGDKLAITKFRSAEVLMVDSTGAIVDRIRPVIDVSFSGARSAAVAWRAVGTSTMMAVVHQSGQDDPVGTNPGGYGGSGKCGGIVSGQVTVVQDDGIGTTGKAQTGGLPFAVLPVDIAASTDGLQLAVVAAGNAHNSGMPTLFVGSPSVTPDPCGGGWNQAQAEGEPTAVAFAGEDIIVQSRMPAQIQIFNKGTITPRLTIPLSTIDRADTGHRIFHANSGAFVACASCHPEGGDDGRVWSFVGIGRRRTQTFRGGLLGTEPFHWDGDQKDLRMLMTTVFQKRMSGPVLQDDQLAVLTKWIDHVPNLPVSKPQDPDAVARGKILFNDGDVACSGCHTGSTLTSNATVDVGTGGAFQVPSLRGIAHRAPYLHTGCAATLTDRFGACGGGDAHGKTSHLTKAQIADLVAYLETL
ncbi:MAG: c-type cytochrome [Polyangiales bacterium]